MNYHHHRVFNLFAVTIVFMWTMWISIVCTTDFFSLLQGLKLIPVAFPASSHNLELVDSFFKHYYINNASLSLFCFSLILIWAVVIAAMYWRALIAYFVKPDQFFARSLWAFFINMGLTITFLIADEMFIQYPASHDHVVRLIFTFTSLLLFLNVMERSTHGNLAA